MKSIAKKLSSCGMVKMDKSRILFSVLKKNFRHTNNLNEIASIAEDEQRQRSGKFLEYTYKVYKPSKTIQFDRNGEVLLFSCDNVKHSQIYTKYPYVLLTGTIPLGFYNFFIDPCKFFN